MCKGCPHAFHATQCSVSLLTLDSSGSCRRQAIFGVPENLRNPLEASR